MIMNVGDTIQFQDAYDADLWHDCQLRGFHEGNAIVIWNGSQMAIERSRVREKQQEATAMTLQEFRDSKEIVTTIEEVAALTGMSEEEATYIDLMTYANRSCYIEYGEITNEYCLTIGNWSMISNDLEKLEEKLYHDWYLTEIHPN